MACTDFENMAVSSAVDGLPDEVLKLRFDHRTQPDVAQMGGVRHLIVVVPMRIVLRLNHFRVFVLHKGIVQQVECERQQRLQPTVRRGSAA